MTKSQYGIVIGIVGMVVAFWRWRHRMMFEEPERRDRGEVIFSNTPQPSEP